MQGMGRLMNRRENNFKQASGHGLDPAGNPVSEWDYLNNFFKRYNKVLAMHWPSENLTIVV